MNPKGDIVIPAEYDDVGNFSEGLAPVRLNNINAYIDKTGKMLFEDKHFTNTLGFKEGRARISVKPGKPG